MEKEAAFNEDARAESPVKPTENQQDAPIEDGGPKALWYARMWRTLLTPGSALQIVAAAVVAIAIGLGVTASVSDIPEAAPVILEIPGALWLRALRATVLPLIITAMILAVQRLKGMAGDGAKLARWTLSYYVLTTILAIVHSTIMTALVWRPLMVEVGQDALAVEEGDLNENIEDRQDNQAHDVVVDVFYSFIPSNIFNALAEDSLLAVLVASVVVGALIRGPNSSLLRGIVEVERIITTIITFLIKLAPIGVFFLILSNLLVLDITDIGQNLGVLIGASLTGMAVQMFIVFPILFFVATRQNPYTYWIKNSPAWITAWGSASSAATIPVTLRCVKKQGVPDIIAKFTVPLGALVNMDGTAIYFPVVVVFLAATQGIVLNAGHYVIIVLLATLSSIATTPIPSASLVLTVIIANSVNVPVTGMFALVVAIDWFIDRFRTATNVSSDLFAAKIMEKVTKIKDSDNGEVIDEQNPIDASDRA